MIQPKATQVSTSILYRTSGILNLSRLCFRLFDIEPSACLSIEDTAAGVASARAAGLMTLGLATTISRDALASAHRVVETLEGVDVDRLEQWFG